MLKVNKKGLVVLQDNKSQQKKEHLPVHFSMPNEDGDRFSRCLQGLRDGDFIEVKFLPYCPKEAEA